MQILKNEGFMSMMKGAGKLLFKKNNFYLTNFKKPDIVRFEKGLRVLTHIFISQRRIFKNVPITPVMILVSRKIVIILQDLLINPNSLQGFGDD